MHIDNYWFVYLYVYILDHIWHKKMSYKYKIQYNNTNFSIYLCRYFYQRFLLLCKTFNYQIISCQFLKCPFIWKRDWTRVITQKQKSWINRFTPKIPKTSWAQPGWSQRSETQVWVSHVGGRNPNTWAIICCFPGYTLAGLGSQAEILGLKLDILIQHASIPSEGLRHCVKHLPHNLLSFQAKELPWAIFLRDVL